MASQGGRGLHFGEYIYAHSGRGLMEIRKADAGGWLTAEIEETFSEALYRAREARNAQQGRDSVARVSWGGYEL